MSSLSRKATETFHVLGIFAAIAASVSIVQGFALWPIGLICLLWVRPWVKRTYFECGVWIVAAALTAGVYSIGFNFNNQSCGPQGCTANFAFQHPGATVRFLLILVGNAFLPTASRGSHRILSPVRQPGVVRHTDLARIRLSDCLVPPRAPNEESGSRSLSS